MVIHSSALILKFYCIFIIVCGKYQKKAVTVNSKHVEVHLQTLTNVFIVNEMLSACGLMGWLSVNDNM